MKKNRNIDGVTSNVIASALPGARGCHPVVFSAALLSMRLMRRRPLPPPTFPGSGTGHAKADPAGVTLRARATRHTSSG